MKRFLPEVRFAALAFVLGGCGGDSSSNGRPYVVPVVPAGASEAGCQTLCTLSATETVCTAQHVEFCIASCRASTQGLPAACADCLIANGRPIEGGVDSGGEGFCSVGSLGEISFCSTQCDDAGATPPAPDLETQCQLACGFYTDNPVPFACSADASADCLGACRVAIAARGRICAQCLIGQTLPGSVCFNDDCDCLISFDATVNFTCSMLCDNQPPMTPI
jgi:hypothetical protein